MFDDWPLDYALTQLMALSPRTLDVTAAILHPDGPQPETLSRHLDELMARWEWEPPRARLMLAKAIVRLRFWRPSALTIGTFPGHQTLRPMQQSARCSTPPRCSQHSTQTFSRK